jgi:hypothetical protein
VRTYEVVFRFRSDVEPRMEIVTADVHGKVVPYIFPRGATQVVYLGSTVTRLDTREARDG